MVNSNSESEITHRELDTDAENPGIEVVAAIADIDGREMTDLSPFHNCIDGVLDDLFSDPPSSEAEMRIVFNYEGYRVGVRQDGSLTLIKTE